MCCNEYKYYKQNGNLMRLWIEQDEVPSDPRHDLDCNVGEIVCFTTAYRYLSDDNKTNNDAEDFFTDLCLKYLKEEQVKELVDKRMEIVSIEAPTVKKPNKAEYDKDVLAMVEKYNAMSDKARELELEHDSIRYINMASVYKRRQEDDYQKTLRLSEEYKVKNDVGWFQFRGTKEECEDYINGELRKNLLDGDIFYASAGMYKEAMEMLRKSDVVILPVYVFDHSGISISTSDFADKWDSGQAGWIYTTKEKVMECLNVTEENWREIATECLESEIKTYDMYLQGKVYGIIIERYNADDDEWEENESSWGYFSDKYGNDLIKDIAVDFGITETLYDDLNDARVL